MKCIPQMLSIEVVINQEHPYRPSFLHICKTDDENNFQNAVLKIQVGHTAAGQSSSRKAFFPPHCEASAVSETDPTEAKCKNPVTVLN